MDCDFNNELLTCPRCGYKAGGRDWAKNCTGPEPQGPPKPGLGDLASYAMAHLGITKEKFSEWIGKECNCPERQEKLNRFGRYLAKRAEKLGITLPY